MFKSMPSSRAATVQQLRSLLQSRGLPLGVARQHVERTGLPQLDHLIGGWPRPGLVEISGPPGSGRLGLLLPLLERETVAGRWVGVVDVLGQFYPPGYPGLDLSRVLLVRSGQERALWAAEQMAASGALGLVVLLDPVPLGRGGHRLRRAVERGKGVVVVLVEAPDPLCPSYLALAVRAASWSGLRVQVLRHKGRQAREGLVDL